MPTTTVRESLMTGAATRKDSNREFIERCALVMGRPYTPNAVGVLFQLKRKI